jgi:LacI family transcriptional regulator
MTTLRRPRRTIKDVAEQAGVSLGTVSGVLNGTGCFSEGTRQRVWAVANELNYTPNRQARTLRAGGRPDGAVKTGIIMHVSHLGEGSPTDDPLEAPRSLLLAWLAEQRGMYPISYWYHTRKGFQCPPVLNGHVDGAIVGTPHPEVVRLLRERLPLVLLDVPFMAANVDVPMVNVDLRQGFGRLMAELAALGHRRLGLVASDSVGDGVSTEAPNRQAIVDAARLAGLELPADCCLSDQITPATHEAMMARLAEAFVPHLRSGRITAIVAAGMSYGVTLYEHLTRLGIRVPADVSLAMPYPGMGPPPHGIAAVAIDWRAMIETALDVLGAQLDGKPSRCREFLVPPLFLPGATLGPPPTRQP